MKKKVMCAIDLCRWVVKDMNSFGKIFMGTILILLFPVIL